MINPNYQFNLPRFLGYSIPTAIICTGLAIYLFFYSDLEQFIRYSIGILLLGFGLSYVAIYLLVKQFTSLERRLADRDILIDNIPWRGNEAVLDIGCGNGILILSAAKRLNTGKAIGIDLWTENSGDNKKEIFISNAKIEGVSNKVELETEDARSLPYEDNCFDVILCGLTVHHLLHGDGADKAIKEMVRVLKSHGRIAVYDVPIAIFSATKLLKREGIKVNKINSRIILGEKSAIK